MPNVGKSTLLNALRNVGIPGRELPLAFCLILQQHFVSAATPKALRTSAHPGLTRALSTRLKLSSDPLVYAFDTPGVMLPFFGRGEKGAERGVKLALIGRHSPVRSDQVNSLMAIWNSGHQGRAVRYRGACNVLALPAQCAELGMCDHSSSAVSVLPEGEG